MVITIYPNLISLNGLNGSPFMFKVILIRNPAESYTGLRVIAWLVGYPQ